MANITPYEFVGTPVENINNVIIFPETLFPRSYQNILFHDSVFSFYPYAEIAFKDEIGSTIDKMNFVEGFEWNLKFGSNEQKIKRKGNLEPVGYLNHNYAWSQPDFDETKIMSNLSGIQNFILISSYFLKEDFKSKITWNAKISDVVKEALNDYGVIASSKRFISDTIGSSYWPRYSVYNKMFLKQLANVAYQASKSPFLTFFNCNGEFYFMSLIDLFKQDSIGTYVLKYEETSTIDYWAIQDYRILGGGLATNKEHYKDTAYRLNDDGTITSTSYLLKDYYLKQNSKDKFLVRTKSTTGKNQSINLGITESTEMDIYNAKVNNLFLNSNLSYQMEIVVKFNPQAVSGKILNIEVNKSDNTAKMLEFSGNWLICDSQHMCDDRGIPNTKLLIAKSAIQVNRQNPYYGEFI